MHFTLSSTRNIIFGRDNMMINRYRSCSPGRYDKPPPPRLYIPPYNTLATVRQVDPEKAALCVYSSSVCFYRQISRLNKGKRRERERERRVVWEIINAGYETNNARVIGRIFQGTVITIGYLRSCDSGASAHRLVLMKKVLFLVYVCIYTCGREYLPILNRSDRFFF